MEHYQQTIILADLMAKTPVQSKKDVQAILNSSGLKPDKHFGQNFLIDGNLMRKLVEGAEIGDSDTVLEVGGGDRWFK